MNLLIHTINRKHLSEGRNSGLAIGLAEKIIIGDDITFILKTGLSCCKDYLNDVVATEKSGFKEGTVYGFKYEKKSFKIKDVNHLLFRAEHMPHVKSIEKKHLDSGYFGQVLNFKYYDNIENAKYIINRIEKEIFNLSNNLTTFDVISDYVSNDDKEYSYPIVVANFSKFWMNNQLGISLYSSLVRRALCVTEITNEEKELPILKFIESFSKKKNLGEGFELNIFKKLTIPELQFIFKNNLKKLPLFLEYKTINSCVHNYGIASFLNSINHNKKKVFETLNLIINEEKSEIEIENESKNQDDILAQPQGVQLDEINGGIN